MKRGALGLVVAITLVGCGGSSGTPTMSPASVATQLRGWMQANSSMQGVRIGAIHCDSALSHVGDVSLCTTTLNGPGEDGTFIVSVTQVDAQGHVRWAVDHQVTK